MTTTNTNGSTLRRMVHHTLGPVDMATNLAKFAEQNPDRFDSAMVTYTDSLARRLSVEVARFNSKVKTVLHHTAKAVETINGETSQTPEMVGECIVTQARDLQSHGSQITALVQTVFSLAQAWCDADLMTEDEWQRLFPRNAKYTEADGWTDVDADTTPDA